MIYLQLFWEFFKVGLFSVGGGMATLPFLAHMGDATGWFTQSQLMNMLAISESTPGPVGINMATYVGFTTAGVPGAIVATVGEVTPSIIVILTIAALLQQFRQSKYVQFAFYGLRPASTGLIGAACLGVILETLVNFAALSGEGVDWAGLFNWRGLALAGVLLVFTTWVKPTKKWHPIVFIVISAAVGVAFRFGGA
ncbi:MAG: chromate transporter [Oscillibacter sp.]|nr:chromate transporter [Oscillibacter sp.]MEA4992552.1 chromate transporter [Oscillibacter sp.]